MFTLKLYSNWLEMAEYLRMPKKQIKEITKLVATLQVVESTDEYTIYKGV